MPLQIWMKLIDFHIFVVDNPVKADANLFHALRLLGDIRQADSLKQVLSIINNQIYSSARSIEHSKTTPCY